MAAEQKISTLFYHNWIKQLEKMPIEEVGKITLALLKFDAYGELPTGIDNFTTELLLDGYIDTVKIDRVKYTNKCEKNKKIADEREEAKRVKKHMAEHKERMSNKSDNDTVEAFVESWDV